MQLEESVSDISPDGSKDISRSLCADIIQPNMATALLGSSPGTLGCSFINIETYELSSMMVEQESWMQCDMMNESTDFYSHWPRFKFLLWHTVALWS